MSHRYLLLLSVLCLFRSEAIAQDTAKAKPAEIKLNAAEQAFVDQLTKATLVGRFSVESRPDRNPQPERYTIESVRKTGGDNWIVQARITYGKYDLPVPVPVQVLWAGDTPILQVTNLKIPLMGEGFTARVMFYKNRYAGSWYHGKVGGHMWGAIEKEKPKQPEVLKENTEN
ncbi:hypothetical protein OAF42_03720 [Planctomicrobium sp.]|jgi:hypothetical protein|nr:hypothetical protein [Planctomicrobium sp.]MBT5019270.1 hypothetical protein [Planctomicrobium sp.]MDA7504116.1 hypothetical protein [bacterium]MDB4733532.1 hypothetical protein [Planctomicrobium sp.]